LIDFKNLKLKLFLFKKHPETKNFAKFAEVAKKMKAKFNLKEKELKSLDKKK